MTEVPEYYFRVRDSGAFVFHIDPETRMKRLDMTQIAVVNVRNGEVKAHGDHALSDQDRQAIDAWLTERRNTLQARKLEDAKRLADDLNLATVWAQQAAAPEELSEVSDRLLLAMHDLRAVLVRKRAQGVARD
ncbi:MAG: hypothetical protein AAF222_11510 [Pseudomonadota bacterium]